MKHYLKQIETQRAQAEAPVPVAPIASAIASLSPSAITAAREYATNGDIASAHQLLRTQAATLDMAFHGLITMAAHNLTSHPSAAERYLKLSMKAQAQSAATIALHTKLEAPKA
jgi:hypothetical protein